MKEFVIQTQNNEKILATNEEGIFINKLTRKKISEKDVIGCIEIKINSLDELKLNEMTFEEIEFFVIKNDLCL